jgi:hypothetical protein
LPDGSLMDCSRLAPVSANKRADLALYRGMSPSASYDRCAHPPVLAAQDAVKQIADAVRWSKLQRLTVGDTRRSSTRQDYVTSPPIETGGFLANFCKATGIPYSLDSGDRVSFERGTQRGWLRQVALMAYGLSGDARIALWVVRIPPSRRQLVAGAAIQTPSFAK